MINRFGFILILLFYVITISYASDFSDPLLDESIEEFSKENYIEALEIVESILVVEPDNEIAKMYKKTIEDVMILDQEVEEQNKVIENTSLNNEVEQNLTTTNISTDTKISYLDDILSLSLYLGENSNGYNIIDQRIKFILGLPVIDLRFTSGNIDFDFSELSLDAFPFDDIFDLESYKVDLGVGFRIKPFESLNINSGYFDFMVGVSSFSNDSYYMVPFLGFDTEVFIFSPLSDNFLSQSLWIGGGASIYSFDGDSINNFTAEVKAGVRVGRLSLAWFYNMSNFDSIADSNTEIYGFMTGLTF